MTETTATAIADALSVLDHARTDVQSVNEGDEVVLYDGIPAAQRCPTDNGYTLQTIVSVERISDDLVEVETSLRTFRCSPRFQVLLVGHHRED